MKNHFQKRSTVVPLLACFTGILLVMFGLVFALPLQSALASPPAQGGYPVGTATATQAGYPVATSTQSGYPVVTNTPSVAATGVTATATRSGTLPPPSVTGTPTVLFPVTGADLTHPSGQQPVGMWIALWLVGLLLIGYGLRSKLGKQ